jgi:hypothetical protein
MKQRTRWIAAATAGAMLAVLGWEVAHRPAQGVQERRVSAAPHGKRADPSMTALRMTTVQVPAPRAAGATQASDPSLAPQFRQCQHDYVRAVQSRAQVLATSADARERLGAVLMTRTAAMMAAGDGMRAFRQALASAAERAPDDALAAWLHAIECRSDEQCDVLAATNHLLQVEPGNGAAWWLAIDVAISRDDTAQADALLQQAARAARFDLHWGETARLTRLSIGPLSPTPACEQASDDMAVAQAVVNAGMALPPLGGILKLCPPRGAVLPGRLAACRSMFLQMTRSDELLPYMIGVRGLAAHAATLAERAQWRERLRNAEWMLRQGGTLLSSTLAPMTWEQGEVPVLIALLEEAGRWPAPANWQPDDPASMH